MKKRGKSSKPVPFIPKKEKLPSENELARQQLELDEDELKHLKELDEKYRDRAKERRIELEAGLDLPPDEEDLVVETQGEKFKTNLSGLDFSLFRKQVEIEEEEKKKVESEVSSESDEEVQGSIMATAEQKLTFKSQMAANVYRVLFKDGEQRQTRRNIFKGNCCYEFDADPNFGNTLPKLVIRNKSKKQEETQIIPKININLQQKINTASIYIKSGKKVEPKGPSQFDAKLKLARADTNKNAVDSDDEDSIFPGAAKKIKVDFEIGKNMFGKSENMEEEKVSESEPRMAGLFSTLTHKKPEMMEEEETERYDDRSIIERNKTLLLEMAKKRHDEKLDRLQNQDTSYMEAFPEDAPELEDLKSMQKAVLDRIERRKEKEKEKKEGKPKGKGDRK